MPCRVLSLGRMEYDAAWALQKQTAEARGADRIPDTLLYVEHPHTYTLGTAGDASNVLLSEAELAARGIRLFRVDRGGDVTYHGPGQIVGYPILKLPTGPDGLHADVVAYVRALESVLIAALAEFGITAGPYPGLTGVWIDPEGESPAKIAAIGVRVTTRRVTLHGFALNVTTDLSYFEGIIPCGIRDKAVTSMAAQLGTAPATEQVQDTISRAFAAQFGVALEPEEPDHRRVDTGSRSYAV